MRRSYAAVAIIAAACALGAQSTPAGQPTPARPASAAAVGMTATIHSKFVEAERATHYWIRLGPLGTDFANYNRRVVWSLELVELGDGGKLDPNCKNTETRFELHSDSSFRDETLIWHHGNVGDPIEDDGCHHELQGPVYGHEGRVHALVTSDVDQSRTWRCDVTYLGSNLNDKTPFGSTVGCVATPRPKPKGPDCDELLERLGEVETKITTVSGTIDSLRKTLNKANADFPKARAWLLRLETQKASGTLLDPARADLEAVKKAIENTTGSLAAMDDYLDELRQESAAIKKQLKEKGCVFKAFRTAAVAGCVPADRAAAKAKGRSDGYALTIRRLRLTALSRALNRLDDALARVRKAAADPHLSRTVAANAVTALTAAARAGRTIGTLVTTIRKKSAAAAVAYKQAKVAAAKCKAAGG